jgi:ABC-type phosphonate transport system ATPase subunit
MHIYHHTTKYLNTAVWHVDTLHTTACHYKRRYHRKQVAESGDNMSAGQKQLLCLARAILQRNNILVMDEASSSIDTNTDVSNHSHYQQYYNVLAAMHVCMQAAAVMCSMWHLEIDTCLCFHSGKLIRLSWGSITALPPACIMVHTCLFAALAVYTDHCHVLLLLSAAHWTESDTTDSS